MPPEKDLCGTISGQSVLLKKEPILVSQHGFTLLEVLVAFAIMALSVGLLYQALGSNARQTADTTAREHAALLAESLLAMHETVPVQGVHETGISADMPWQIDSAPFDTPVSRTSPQAPPLHEVRVRVRWSQEPSREITLRTLRPQRLPQQTSRSQP